MDFLQHARREGKKFLNPVPTKVQTGSIRKTLWAYLTNKKEVVPKNPIGPFYTDRYVYQTPPASGLRITWIGHSTILVEIDGRRILTDPIWSNRASFSTVIGPKRFFPPTIALDKLPKLDGIIISHDHYDHLDKATIEMLSYYTQAYFYCSLNVGKYLEKWGIQRNRIIELDWADTALLSTDFSITATPARHFSGRGLNNRYKTLWSSFIIKGGQHKVFFGADSGWFPGFKDIGNYYGPFDLVMLDMGAYNENWADIHMRPEQAIEASIALKGKLMMPIHWGTFNLALHSWKDPVNKLLDLTEKKKIQLFLPKPGKPSEVTGVAYNSKWWEI